MNQNVYFFKNNKFFCKIKLIIGKFLNLLEKNYISFEKPKNHFFFIFKFKGFYKKKLQEIFKISIKINYTFKLVSINNPFLYLNYTKKKSKNITRKINVTKPQIL